MPTNSHLSLLAQAKPCSHSKGSSLPVNEKKGLQSPIERPYESKFDKAIRVYISHFSEKGVRKTLKEVTSQEETAPSPSAMQALALSQPLIKAIQKIPLEYKPTYLETSASIHSELGNSIHSSSSVARRSMDLYGLRVFKACIIVHRMLKGAADVAGEGVREELGWWFEVLRHDLELAGVERGYGRLLGFYITYLKAIFASLSTAVGTAIESRTFISAHQSLSLSNHAFREALLTSITSCPASLAGAKIGALKLVVADAMEFPAVHEKVLGMMKRECVSEGVVEERERVFEIRREEVVGFLRRCEGLGLDLALDLNRDGSGVDVDVDVEQLQAKVGKLRV
ncbi:hypothetical protein IFR05_007196 [Cadophora sp. M221]|nr:hypothetical protein IFR05_007196 [Cadophora sp. M221]